MYDIGKTLRKLRKEKNLTQEQLAEKLQCSRQSISCYENNTNLDRVYEFQKICKFFGKNMDYLLTGEDFIAYKDITMEQQEILNSYNHLTDSDKRIVDFILRIGEGIIQEAQKPKPQPRLSNKVIKLLDKGDIVLIDTYSLPVSAGYGNILIEDTPIEKPYQTTPISIKADFCVKVSGDSMEPYCQGGDFLFVQKTEEELQNKELGIFLYGGESVFKEYCNKNGYKALKSRNTSYDDKVINETNPCITLGRVLGKYHID